MSTFHFNPEIFPCKDGEYSVNIKWKGPTFSSAKKELKKYHLIFSVDRSGSMDMTIGSNFSGSIGMPFTPSLSRGVSTSCAPPPKRRAIQRRFASRSMPSPISLSQVDNDDDYFLSSSSGNSRSVIVCKSLFKTFDLIKKLNSKGYDIKVSLIGFSMDAEVLIEYEKINDIHYSNLYEWLRPRTSTDFKPALDLMRHLKSKYPDDNTIKILISDGEHNGDYTKELLEREYSNALDLCIGIGKTDEYDEDMLLKISKDNCLGAPDEYTFRDHFTGFVFGSTTCVAKDINILVNGEVISPANIKDNIITLDDFHSHRIIPLFFPKETKIEISYTDIGDSNFYSKEFMINKSSEFFIDDKTQGLEILHFCNISNHIVNNDLSKEEVIETIALLDELIAKDKKTFMKPMLNVLRDQLLKATETTDARTFVSMMRNVSAQTSSCRPSQLMRAASDSVAYDDDIIECIICRSKPRTTVLRPCSHCIACTSCAIEMVNHSKRCPICRATATNVHVLNTFHPKCLECGINNTTVFVSNCRHGCLCKKCMIKRLKEPGSLCPECGIQCDRYITFIFS